MDKSINHILKTIKDHGNPQIAAHSQRFFKTGKGEYGEGDVFLGIRVPVIRKIANEYKYIAMFEVLELLQSQFHEVRMLALVILVSKFNEQAQQSEGKQIYNNYLKHTEFINNWDLVDCSAGPIVGGYLFKRDRTPIHRLVKSLDLWERRIGVMSTLYFIKQDDHVDILQIAEVLLEDDHDLIQKAVGWMLREVGKRDIVREEAFLLKHYKKMPRTMLRYAIEKFPEKERKAYLQGEK
ncbi:MAG TPA: DNA alkylation repair protein [Deltaproteobacteria bacterium]|nr:DNA alkylation repair protein [Deltaproteobacteria bacterium]